MEKHSNTFEFIILLEPIRFATTHTTIKNARIYVIGTSGKYKILNEQTAPFNPAKKRLYDQVTLGASQQAGESQSIELPSVNAKLNPDDTLGLLINSESVYYQKIKQPKIEAEISGQIVLPKLWSETAQ